MKTMLTKVKRYHKLIAEKRFLCEERIGDILTCPAEYKNDNVPPPASAFVPLGADGVWGSGQDSHAWFSFRTPKMPENGFLRIRTDQMYWDSVNPQFIVYIDGGMRMGADANHWEFPLAAGEHDILLYGYTGPRTEKTQLFVSVGEWDPEVTALYYDILYPLQMLGYLNAESGEYAEILRYLYEAVSLLDFLDDESFRASVGAARAFMTEEFYGKYCQEQASTVICIGHTHIDCAYRWTIKQTREKVQRSFSTVLDLMERYPEYLFMSSQPCLYQFMKEEAPEQYAKIIERVREGRWEAEGAMWVEPDCNLPSGESLVRQLLHGKKFFRDEFGVESHILWLPDVFGYSAALPQILRKSGVDWFVTSKISWNDTNRMPYDTFAWRGIDGTEINSYFLTAQDDKGDASRKYTVYSGEGTAPYVAGTYKRYGQKYLNNEALLAFGYGDGGGGPTAAHLELLRRGSRGVPGCPGVRHGFVGDFLGRLGERIKENPKLPKWQGELYLEFHRGTYTTMAKNKRKNRKAEFLYQNAELLSALTGSLLGVPTQREALWRGWQSILTNQFHDIIPGSSIREVYEQSDIDYAEIFAIGEQIREGALSRLAASFDQRAGYVVLNPTAFPMQGMVCVNGKTALTREAIAPLGYTVTDALILENQVRIEGNTVETEQYRVRFDEAWQMVSIYDKANCREVLSSGGVGNELRVYADYPDQYDAWEWQPHSREKYKALTALSSVEIVEDGARRGIRLTRPHGKSTVVQTVWFYDTLRRIDFDTVADWHEQHQMLKCAFAVDINADFATYEIQFGHLRRPTHFNTSWDAAKFEVCGHKFADYSEGGYGVGLLNDCKYGHDIHEGVMQLSLLRSPTEPNEVSDQGEMRCTYALCPHAGTFAESDLIREAYRLNNPMTATPATGEKNSLPLSFSLARTDKENVICETVKPSEDGSGTVLRLYEAKNSRTDARVTLDIPASHVYLCDLMENELCELPLENGAVSLTFRGFEIHTLKIKP